MKFLYKSIFIASLALCLTSITAFATEIQNVTSSGENINFNYQTNAFDIDAGTGAATDVELTVMLVKGDLTGQEANLSQISVDDIYYVGQMKGKDYDVFDGLGVKYDTNAFEPGVYTLITSGEGVSMKKTKLVIGNAINKDDSLSAYLPGDWKADDYSFGSVCQTVRYYPEDTDGKYIYVCRAIFPSITNLENAGFVFQNISGTSTKYLYRSLEQFNLDFLQDINSISADIEIGVQVNNVPVEGENAVENIVAIPYVRK